MERIIFHSVGLLLALTALTSARPSADSSGVYTIDNGPIDLTIVNKDPEHPILRRVTYFKVEEEPYYKDEDINDENIEDLIKLLTEANTKADDSERPQQDDPEDFPELIVSDDLNVIETRSTGENEGGLPDGSYVANEPSNIWDFTQGLENPEQKRSAIDDSASQNTPTQVSTQVHELGAIPKDIDHINAFTKHTHKPYVDLDSIQKRDNISEHLQDPVKHVYAKTGKLYNNPMKEYTNGDENDKILASNVAGHYFENKFQTNALIPPKIHRENIYGGQRKNITGAFDSLGKHINYAELFDKAKGDVNEAIDENGEKVTIVHPINLDKVMKGTSVFMLRKKRELGPMQGAEKSMRIPKAPVITPEDAAVDANSEFGMYLRSVYGNPLHEPDELHDEQAGPLKKSAEYKPSKTHESTTAQQPQMLESKSESETPMNKKAIDPATLNSIFAQFASLISEYIPAKPSVDKHKIESNTETDDITPVSNDEDRSDDLDPSEPFNPTISIKYGSTLKASDTNVKSLNGALDKIADDAKLKLSIISIITRPEFLTLLSQLALPLASYFGSSILSSITGRSDDKSVETQDDLQFKLNLTYSDNGLNNVDNKPNSGTIADNNNAKADIINILMRPEVLSLLSELAAPLASYIGNYIAHAISGNPDIKTLISRADLKAYGNKEVNLSPDNVEAFDPDLIDFFTQPEITHILSELFKPIASAIGNAIAGLLPTSEAINSAVENNPSDSIRTALETHKPKDLLDLLTKPEVTSVIVEILKPLLEYLSGPTPDFSEHSRKLGAANGRSNSNVYIQFYNYFNLDGNKTQIFHNLTDFQPAAKYSENIDDLKTRGLLSNPYINYINERMNHFYESIQQQLDSINQMILDLSNKPDDTERFDDIIQTTTKEFLNERTASVNDEITVENESQKPIESIMEAVMKQLKSELSTFESHLIDKIDEKLASEDVSNDQKDDMAIGLRSSEFNNDKLTTQWSDSTTEQNEF